LSGLVFLVWDAFAFFRGGIQVNGGLWKQRVRKGERDISDGREEWDLMDDRLGENRAKGIMKNGGRSAAVAGGFCLVGRCDCDRDTDRNKEEDVLSGLRVASAMTNESTFHLTKNRWYV
ncbi:MAG: hypothetical protein ACOC2L_04390, partial [Candidatus Sumerlaeota bacterium]